jgi:hypothetical protein
MPIKRLIDTRFWSDGQVLDSYSPEDKLFALYLRTNPHSSQLGVYALPKRTMSFEIGYTPEAIAVLLDRFQTKYHDIVYSDATQEVAILGYLKSSIIKGGKPVLDLLKRELEEVVDGDLLLHLHEAMADFLGLSTREVDGQILKLIEAELQRRGLRTQNQNDKDNDNEINQYNEIYNDNEESLGRNVGTNRTHESLPRIMDQTTHGQTLASQSTPVANSNQIQTGQKLVQSAFTMAFGPITLSITETLNQWTRKLGASKVQDAINLASKNKAKDPIRYISAVCLNWEQAGR